MAGKLPKKLPRAVFDAPPTARTLQKKPPRRDRGKVPREPSKQVAVWAARALAFVSISR